MTPCCLPQPFFGMDRSMYQLDDTIVAVSSPTSDQRVIVRLSGPGTMDVVRRVFYPGVSGEGGGLMRGKVAVDAEMGVDAELYFFSGPHSYTGQDVAEIHVHTNPSVTEALMANILGSRASRIRTAGPGEFTARAYLNGKIDLAQAEAVNEIIVSSNRFQLAAAEKLLAGRLGETTAKIRADIMDCLSLIEAGLDFSEEDIELVRRSETAARLERIKRSLEELLSGSIGYECTIDLPAVGIAGAPNAGKSSLLNMLLGRERSIVSDQYKTTRDVLTGTLALEHCECVFFDCAGLIRSPENMLDELAQQAAVEALRNSSVVVFCVDGSKPEYSEDIAIRGLIEPNVLIGVATKADLVAEDTLDGRICRLNEVFGIRFIAVSAKTGAGVGLLREVVDKQIMEQTLAASEAGGAGRAAFSDALHTAAVTLTARHKQAVTEAAGSIAESVSEQQAGNDEVVAMLLRAAYQVLSTIEQESVSEEILARIFQRFCIGK